MVLFLLWHNSIDLQLLNLIFGNKATSKQLVKKHHRILLFLIHHLTIYLCGPYIGVADKLAYSVEVNAGSKH